MRVSAKMRGSCFDAIDRGFYSIRLPLGYIQRALSLHDLRFAYGSTPISKESRSMQLPGFIVIVGPNGAGKIHALKILAGLLRNYSATWRRR